MDERLKILPIGGMGDVTKNMFVYQWGDDALLVDCGIGFPSSTMLGVDILIPDITYLTKNQPNIVGMILTHAHDDHIAALPYILPQLPEFPIYGSALTVGFAQDRLEDFNLDVDFREFPDDQVLDLGPFRLESIKVTHSVPDTRHYAIHTPIGTVYHGSDFKFDNTPVDRQITDYSKIARIGQEGIVCLLSDCLRSEKQSHSLSESILTKTFEDEIRGVKGKFIVTAMSSNVHRIQQAVNVAVAHGRKVAFVGRSVEQNIKTATKLGFFSIPDGSVINKKKINKYPPDEVCVIIAGSQGQPESSLSRAGLGEHSLVTIDLDDKVVFSSEPIPGNEDNVYTAIDNIARIGADIAYSDVDDNLHVSGHASAIEQQLLIALTKPKVMVPIGGTYRHMIQYRTLAEQMGYLKSDTFILDDGDTLELGRFNYYKGEKLKLKQVMVDGTGIGDVGTIVLSDRKTMSENGMVVIILSIDIETKSLIGEVEVVSRGFVFMKNAQELVGKIKNQAKEAFEFARLSTEDPTELKKEMEEKVADMLFRETEREPLILSVLMGVKE